MLRSRGMDPYEIEERAAIYEHDAGMSREDAERKAGITAPGAPEPGAASLASAPAPTRDELGSSRGWSG